MAKRDFQANEIRNPRATMARRMADAEDESPAPAPAAKPAMSQADFLYGSGSKPKSKTPPADMIKKQDKYNMGGMVRMQYRRACGNKKAGVK